MLMIMFHENKTHKWNTKYFHLFQRKCLAKVPQFCIAFMRLHCLWIDRIIKNKTTQPHMNNYNICNHVHKIANMFKLSIGTFLML